VITTGCCIRVPLECDLVCHSFCRETWTENRIPHFVGCCINYHEFLFLVPHFQNLEESIEIRQSEYFLHRYS